MMLSNPPNSASPDETDEKKSQAARKETQSKAAELKLKRERDGSKALKEYEAARLETLAKTARLRAERLAREASVTSQEKLPAAKKPATKKS
jgi:hypothetical protein